MGRSNKCNLWVGQISHNVAVGSMIGCLFFLVRILSHTLMTLGESEARSAPNDSLWISISEALYGAGNAMLGLSNLLMIFLGLLILVESLLIFWGKIHGIRILFSIRLSNVLQKSLVSSVNIVEDNNVDWLINVIRTSQKAQKLAIKVMRRSTVVIGKESFIIVELPQDLRARRIVMNSVDDAVNDIAVLAQKNISAPRRMNVGFRFYLCFDLD